MYTELVKYGYTGGCPKCTQHKQGDHDRARYLSHSEECRRRIYDRLISDGAPKVRTAYPDRTKTSPAHQRSSAASPEMPVPDPNLDSTTGLAFGPAQSDEPDSYDDPEAMYKDMKHDATVSQVMSQISEDEKENDMIALMDVLQTVGVNVENANSFASSIVRDQGQFLRKMAAL